MAIVIGMIAKEISENVYVIQGSPKTLIILSKTNSWIVDPGMGEDRPEVIKKALEELNNHSSIKILLSHAHYDHVEAILGLKDHTTYISRVELGLLVDPSLRERYTYGHNILPRALGLKELSFYDVDVRPLEAEMGLLDEQAEIIKLPGHSPGHIGLGLDDVLFVGDSVFGDKLLKRVGIPYHVDFTAALKTLEYLLDRTSEYRLVVLSHGPMISGKKAENIVEYNISIINRIRELVSEYASKGEFTIDELVGKILKDLSVTITPESVLLGKPLVVSILNHIAKDLEFDLEWKDNKIVWKAHTR